MQSMKRFVSAIRACFESQYLRKPTHVDLNKQLAMNEERGWPGMFASIGCIYWMWKICLVAWQGQFQDKDGYCSIILKAMLDQSH